MAIPAQALRGDAEADRLVSATYAQPGGEPTPQAPASTEPPATPTQTQTDPATPATPQTASDNEEKWQQRYRTLQGMIDANTRRHQAELQEWKDRVSALETKLEQAAKKPEQSAQPSVTDKDVEAFGGDLIDLTRRVAADAAAGVEARFTAALAAKDAEIAELKQQVGGVEQKAVAVTKEAYFKALSEQVPDWRVVNEDQGFLDWLAAKDPLTGLERQAYLDDALTKLDVARTAALFGAYKATKTPPPQSQEGTPQPPRTPQEELLRQVQPASSQGTPIAVAEPVAGRVWSNADIERFYQDVTRGAYTGREADMARINADIDLAMQQGRVRP